MSELPGQARIVVVGGGIIGCSTAYHLAKLGCSDVLLVERAKLTSGSTHHAAGLVGQLRTSASITQLLGHSVALYRSIEEETGQATGWKMNGGLRLACNPERMTELERQATTAHSFGLEMHLLTPSEARDLWPLMATDDLMGAAFLPTDGQANPADITLALAKGARMHGAVLVEDCVVTGVEVRDGRVAAVVTDKGRIVCEIVVNCCGQWAREFGRLAGVNVPLVSIQHQYMITEPIDGVSGDLPTLRDPDRLTYYKEEVGGLVMGGYEPNPLPWAADGIPEGFHFTLLDSDWDHFEQLMAQALPRVPALQDAGVKQLLNGPESFTPDGNFILGEAPEVDGYFVGAGFNAFGIAAGGGAGKALAEWILGGEPPYDLWPVDIRRFGRPHSEIDWVRARTHEMYGKHYTIAWPHEENESSRPYRRSPLYDDLLAAGACFGEKLGWERANWFAPHGVAPLDAYSFDRQNWFPYVGEEHRAVRERVGVFDQTSFAKFEMTGPDCERALSWICANDVAREPGAVVYTQLLNSGGGVECDLTVARVDEDRYYIVTGTGFASHDFHWMRTRMQPGLAAELSDVTDDYSVISVFGPRSRELLSSITDDDLGNDAFPFASVREIRIAGAPVTALRITYVGELGWELHTPVASALDVYRAVMTAGEAHGVAPCGYRAIESLRLEKGYRAWGSDLTPDHSPLQAGLGFAVKLDSNTPFLGREALVEQRREGLTRRLACFTTDDNGIVLLGRETIYRNGERVGWLTSGGFGYTVDKSIGYGYVRNLAGVDREYLGSGDYELEVANRRVPARIHFGPLYDPSNERIRA
jgi:4-methylaminobutanoate oxidase (formaldehyde-forming)